MKNGFSSKILNKFIAHLRCDLQETPLSNDEDQKNSLGLKVQHEDTLMHDQS